MNRKQQLFRLYEGYSALLENAQQHRDFIILHASTLEPKKYQLLLKNADDDIVFARAKLDSMVPTIPKFEAKPVQVTPLHVIPHGHESRKLPKQAASILPGSQVQHAPEMMSEEQTEASLKTPVPSKVQSGAMPEAEHSGSVGWAIAGIAGIVSVSIAAPLLIEWVNKDPQRNLTRVRDFLTAFKNA